MLTEKKIFDKYPELYRQKDLPMTQTCMCWGLDVGPGWLELVDKLSYLITTYSKLSGITVEATQVKEKFGGLRFYYDGGDDYTEQLVSWAETLSYHICEECGSTRDIGYTKGWIRTLCGKHLAQANKEE